MSSLYLSIPSVSKNQNKTSTLFISVVRRLLLRQFSLWKYYVLSLVFQRPWYKDLSTLSLLGFTLYLSRRCRCPLFRLVFESTFVQPAAPVLRMRKENTNKGKSHFITSRSRLSLLPFPQQPSNSCLLFHSS